MIILIPAYEPDAKLVKLVNAILSANPEQRILIVDDGSGPKYHPLFDTTQQLGCEIVRHEENRGKGFALKVGFAHIANNYPEQSVVCADSDGQHTAHDILRVGAELNTTSGIVLGSRQFDTDVPARSRLGNTATRSIYRLLTGSKLRDTQTGLRGYPAELLPWLQSIPGDRFEYELEILLAAKQHGHELHEISIQTIYLKENASSHFRPIRDSIRIYARFLRFAMSSFGAFIIDASIFFALMAATGNLALSVVVARLVSASVNYLTNHQLVFTDHGVQKRTAARRYASLVTVLLVANYLLIRLLTVGLAVPLLPAKVLVEMGLFLASYRVQQRFVFAASPTSSPLRQG